MTINPDAIIDEDGTGNVKTVITTAITTPQNSGEFAWDIDSNSLKYETKLTDPDRKDGYKDESDTTWGSGATVKITMKSTGNGLKHEKYYFDYCWTTKNQNQLTDSDFNNKVLIYPNEGQKSADGTIYVNTGTGKGHLYIRSEDKKSDVKNIAVNLDNTGPTIVDIEERFEFADLDIWGIYNKKLFAQEYVDGGSGQTMIVAVNEDNSSSQQDSDHAKLRFKIKDEQSGIYNKVAGVRVTQGLSTKDNDIEPNFFGPLGSQLEYLYIKAQISRHPNYIYNTFSTVYNVDSSGKYYIWTGNVRYDENKMPLTDNVGNEIVQPTKFGPCYIDNERPKLDKAYIGDDEKGKIVITDDFSGLSKNSDILKKIKYAWIENKDSTPESSELKSIDPNKVEYTNENEFGNFNTLTATVEPPSNNRNYYLYVYVEDYEDISGNPIEKDSKVSEEFCGDSAKDLVISIKEQDEIGYPSYLYITIQSQSQSNFKITKIWYEHVGLDDVVEVFNDIAYCNKKYTISTSSTVNGPIIVHAMDENGNEYQSEQFTITKVQETIITVDLNLADVNTETIMLNLNPRNKNICYVKWGENNSQGEYIIDPTYSISDDVYSFTNDKTKYKSAFHTYSKKGEYQISFSGNRPLENYFSYNGDEYQKLSNTDKTLYDKSIKAITKVNQFGIHKDLNSSLEKWSLYYTFMNCSNLLTLPLSTDNLSINAFADVGHFDNTFSGTAISSLNSNIFEKAGKAYAFSSTFANCKNLHSIPKELFLNCKDVSTFRSTFEGSGLSSIPEELFKDLKEFMHFDSTFENTEINHIPENLFETNINATSFTGVFASCKNLTDISNCSTLFSKNVKATLFYNLFKYTPITSVPEDLFKNNINAYDFISCFAYTNLETIPQKLFSYLKPDSENSYSMNSVFRGTKISSIPDNLFEKLFSVEIKGSDSARYKVDLSSAFWGCNNLKSVNSNMWKTNKNSNYYPQNITNVSSIFHTCRNLVEVKDGLFENFSNLIDCSFAFYDCTSLKEVNSNILKGCSNVEDISSIFYKCSSLQKLGKNVFNDCKIDEIKILSNDAWENKEYSGTFRNCESLPLDQCPEIWTWPQFKNDDLIKENPEDFYEVFYGANSQITDAIRKYVKEGKATDLIEKYWLTKQEYKE